MTPKQKATELFEKYCDYIDLDVDPNADSIKANKIMDDFHEKVKKCTLIAVDEILNLMTNILKWSEEHNGNIHYWQEVKEEINAM